MHRDGGRRVAAAVFAAALSWLSAEPDARAFDCGGFPQCCVPMCDDLCCYLSSGYQLFCPCGFAQCTDPCAYCKPGCPAPPKNCGWPTVTAADVQKKLVAAGLPAVDITQTSVQVITSFPTGAQWKFNVKLSPNDGMSLADVSLGSRYFAAEVDLPYIKFGIGGPRVRCELSPNGPACDAPIDAIFSTGKSRLVSFTIGKHTNALVGTGKGYAVRATYEIDPVDPKPDTCLRVTQEFEFYGIDNFLSDNYCKGFETAPCGRFIPRVSYEYYPNLKVNPPPIVVELPQRFHYAPSLRHGGSLQAGDNPALIPLPIILPYGGNPTKKEQSYFAILRGQAVPAMSDSGKMASVDNYHQSCLKGPVDEPKPPLKSGGLSPSGGCPDCVHTHWRWSSTLGSLLGSSVPGFFYPNGGTSGQPLEWSQQRSLRVASVVHKAGEADPGDFRSLVNNEDLVDSTGTVFYPKDFWYDGISEASVSTGGSPSLGWRDAFYDQGVFFMTDAPACDAVPLSLSLGDEPDDGSPAAPLEPASCALPRDARHGWGIAAALGLVLALRRRARRCT